MPWPGGPACDIADEGVYFGTSVTLKMDRDGPALATTGFAPKVRAAIPVFDGATFDDAMEIEAGGLTLRGVVDGTTVTLHPRRALIVEGYYIPSSGTILDVARAKLGKVDVRVRTTSRVLVAPHAPEGSFACDDVGLDDRSSTPRARSPRRR